MKWVAIPFSRGSFDPEIEPQSPELQVDILPTEPKYLLCARARLDMDIKWWKIQQHNILRSPGTYKFKGQALKHTHIYRMSNMCLKREI